MSGPMLALKNVDVFYGKIHAARRVSLHVKAGEIVALIGGNGAGKTTLLTAVSGLLRPAGGEIALAGESILGLAPERVVRLGLSHVPEGRLVFSPLSVEDNLRLGAYTRRGREGREAAARTLARIYEMFPVLAERRAQAAGTLSGGEQQMLALGRALMAGPRLLLLDEPAAGLNMSETRALGGLIRRIRDERGVAVVLVEHDMDLVMGVSDAVLVLCFGRVIRHGAPAEVQRDPEVVAAYLGADEDET